MADVTITKLSPDEAKQHLTEVGTLIETLIGVINDIDKKLVAAIPSIWEGAAAVAFQSEWNVDKAEYSKKDTNFNDLLTACHASIANVVETDAANAQLSHYH